MIREFAQAPEVKTATRSLLGELEHAISRTSLQRRAEMLMHITDLFIRGSAGFSDEEIELFDGVISRLAFEIDASAKSMLARRLSSVVNAPCNIIRMLAADDEIKIAAPVLAHSERLDHDALVLNARNGSQEHLCAIARRKLVKEVIADVLVERGNSQVLGIIADNLGAEISEAGFALLVKRCKSDDALASSVGRRPDIPRHHLQSLLTTASEAVRSKFASENLVVKREFSFSEPHFIFAGIGQTVLAV